jgi:hypothetical protein
MIPTLGRLAHESYRAQEVKDGDVLVMVAKDVPDGLPGRGELLAQALRGRYAPSCRGYFLTPARARKWHALFMGGATARKKATQFGSVWVFMCKDQVGRCSQLYQALKVVSPKLEVCA